MYQTIVQALGNKSLTQVIENWQEVTLTKEEDAWVEFPPDDFLQFIKSYPATPFDSIPESDNYIKTPSFLITQTHRLWQTSSRVFKQLQELEAKKMVDLGSFPFFLPLILRDYFKFQGEIIATTNVNLSQSELEFLSKKNISIAKLDLDPYVSDPTSPRTEWLPIKLDLADNSIDFIACSHVIEHLYHPRFIIREAYKLLRSGGKIMITTDNAMMIDVFANYIGGYGYVFETIENTAALHFNFWRGHVRFFTELDLSKLVKAENFKVDNVDFFHCFYEVFFDDYFKKYQPTVGGWKRDLLKEVPWLKNDIAITAVK